MKYLLIYALVTTSVIAPASAAFEVLMDGYISVTQLKSADGRLRLEIAQETSKPGTPKFLEELEAAGKVGGVTPEPTRTDDGIESKDFRDAISETRTVIYDSDQDRSVSRDSIASVTGGSGGGGGGCLLK